ncbi:hypothetical protein GCM10010412_101280 [Nonomuraea recticatena]|uniref:Uncharacterized protein n=1 Tax=Nonomuraea recticatena TaxID=46178 RepID=A0ABN3TJB4_9ACTN
MAADSLRHPNLSPREPVISLALLIWVFTSLCDRDVNHSNGHDVRGVSRFM